jgi:AcrR family transcriptional regulator
MVRRRGRPPIISDDRLLEAAREVFLSRGIRATTAEVAERAQISEGTIFHRYKTKDALFRAAMQFDPEDVPNIIESLTPRAGEGDLRETLEALALRVLSFGRVGLPMMMMAWSNPGSEYSFEKMLINKQVGHERPVRALHAFFNGEIERGRLAKVNVEVLTRMFIGTLRDFCVSELLSNSEGRMPPQELAKNVVDLILRAARPEADTPSAKPPAPELVPPRTRGRARNHR